MWNRVVEQMRAGWCCNSAQRVNWTSSSSSTLAKWRLIRQVLVSGQRCSAGWSSGEYGGQEDREEQVEVVGHVEANAGVPSCAVEHQYDLLGRTRPNHVIPTLARFL
jgi:hypothetical protein